MVGVGGIAVRPDHGAEQRAGGALGIAQELLFVGRAAPPVPAHRDEPPVGQHETGNIDGIAEAVFGERALPRGVDAAAVVAAEGADLHHLGAEQRAGGRLQIIIGPALQRRHHAAAHHHRLAERHPPAAEADDLIGIVQPADRRTADGLHRPHPHGRPDRPGDDALPVGRPAPRRPLAAGAGTARKAGGHDQQQHQGKKRFCSHGPQSGAQGPNPALMRAAPPSRIVMPQRAPRCGRRLRGCIRQGKIYSGHRLYRIASL